VPSSFLLNPLENQLFQPSITTHAFELPVKTEKITVSQMWHPRLEVDPVHQWLRRLVLRVCGERVPM